LWFVSLLPLIQELFSAINLLKIFCRNCNFNISEDIKEETERSTQVYKKYFKIPVAFESVPLTHYYRNKIRNERHVHIKNIREIPAEVPLKNPKKG
jgi:hypothetical protein